MQDRPIIFSADMARAILAGRKTQTRRVIKDYPWTRPPYYFCGLRNGLGYPASEETVWAGFTCEGYHSPCYVKCPYGKVGDLLWVRETWGFSAKLPASTKDEMSWLAYPDLRGYRADGHVGYCWRPSIHMPRWASRLTLEVTDIRVERLHDITEADAKAEGAIAWHDTIDGTVYIPEFKMLWDNINAKRGYPWASNPWVWAVKFAVV